MAREVTQNLIEEIEERATNVTKALLEKKTEPPINSTVQQCTNKLNTEYREAIATTLKIQNNKDAIKNAQENIEEIWNDKLKNEIIYFGDITEIKD